MPPSSFHGKVWFSSQPLSPKHAHHIRGRLGSFLQKHRTCCVRKPFGPSCAPANRGAKPTLFKFKRPVEARGPKQTCLPSSISIAHGCVLHNLMMTWNSRKQKYSPPRIPTFPDRIAVPGCPWELAFKGGSKRSKCRHIVPELPHIAVIMTACMTSMP